MQQSCPLCSSSAPAFKLTLSQLRRRILRQNQEYVPDFKDPQAGKAGGFGRLLCLVFGYVLTTPPCGSVCQHHKFSRYFRRKLKCDNSTFNGLCGEVADGIAFRNYQLDTLLMQVPSMATTAVVEASNPLAEVIARSVFDQKVKGRKQVERTDVAMREWGEVRGEEPMPVQGLWGTHPPFLQMPWLFQQHHGN